MFTLQSWADAFRSTPSLGGVVHVYDDLRKRGLEFPMTDLDALSPIHTPNRVRRSGLNSIVWCSLLDSCCHLWKKLYFVLQSIPENGALETSPAVNSSPQPRTQTPSSAATQNTSSAVQPSRGPVALSADQVLPWNLVSVKVFCHLWNTIHYNNCKITVTTYI